LGVTIDNTGNLPPTSGVFPDHEAPVMRHGAMVAAN
jgi:hypothetical protein